MLADIIDNLKVETYNFQRHGIAERERICGIDIKDKITSMIEKRLNTGNSMKINVIPFITCGRVEVIYIGDEFFGIPDFERIEGWEAFTHLVEVAAGIKTLIFGETHIVRQMKDAFIEARENGLCDGSMLGLLSEVLKIAKRVRLTAGIEAKSFASFARRISKEVFGELHDKTIFVIGTGSIAHDIFKIAGEFSRLIIRSHDPQRARERAEKLKKLGINVEHVATIKEGIMSSDVVVVATNHPGYLIKREQFEGWYNSRKILVIDLSVPRNVDPQIQDLGDIILYNVDSASQKGEEEKINLARKIIDEEIYKLRIKSMKENRVKRLAEVKEDFQKIIYEHLRKYTDIEDKEISVISQSLSQKLLARFFEEMKKEGISYMKSTNKDEYEEERMGKRKEKSRAQI